MGLNIGKLFNDLTSNFSSLSASIGSLLGKTGEENTRTPSFTQPFSNGGQNDLTLRNLSFSYLPTQEGAADKKKLQTYRVEIPLAKGSQKASYEELSRRAMRTALEVNGIKPTMRELEEMMTTLEKRPIDFDVKSDDPTKFRATMATPKHIGTTANGEKVMGYSFEMDDKFQRTVIKDYKAAQAALAGKSGEKAVVDMNLTERMGEAIKIAYEKGHISKEVREQLGNLTPTELAVAFGMGGAASLAAKGGAGAALLGMEMIKNGAELEVFGKACARATSRAELEQPAAEFGRWMGELSKAGVLAMAAGAGAKIAPAAMPKATATAEGFFTTSVKGAKEAMRSTKGALAPELVTPQGVTIKIPTSKPTQTAEDLTVKMSSSGSGTTAATGSSTIPNNPKPVTAKTLEHVFHGEINKKGNAVGFHDNTGEMQAVNQTKTISIINAPDKRGVYEAKVEVQGVAKKGKSSFFPDSWSKNDVVKAINQAYQNRQTVQGKPTHYFEGKDSSGMTIGTFLSKNDGTIETAFPIWGK